MQIYATNETHTFCAMDDHVERQSNQKQCGLFVFRLHVSHCAFMKFMKD